MIQCHFTELFKLCYQQNMLKVRMSNHRYVEQLKRTSEESEITIKYLMSANTGLNFIIYAQIFHTNVVSAAFF